MKKTQILLALLLTLVFAATGNAALQDRLKPILTGDVDILVDTFIIATQDRYITTIVRDLDQESVQELGMTLRELFSQQDHRKVTFIERHIFDRHAKRFAVPQRQMVLKNDLDTQIGNEPFLDTDLRDVRPGSLEEFIWDSVAGPQGLAVSVLGELPKPAMLALEYKKPIDKERYFPLAQREVGGMFLDMKSIKKTDDGFSIDMVDVFNFDGENYFGGMVMQYTGLPYVDAHYAISTCEYSFKKREQRQVGLGIFSADNKLIYAIKNANTDWVPEGSDPMMPLVMITVRKSLPQDVEKLLADDLKEFDAFVKGEVEKVERMRQEAEAQGEPKAADGTTAPAKP